MKELRFCGVLLAVFCLACTPKSGDKMSGGPASPAKAPVIPLPTGDVRVSPPKPGPAPQIQLGRAETFTLDNGLKVILVENHKLPRVSYRIFIDKDPVLENESAGYVSLLGEMLTKGTTTRTKAQIDEEVDFMGAGLAANGYGVRGNCLSKHADRLLALLSDVLLHPAFPPEEFDKTRRQQESLLARNKDDVNEIAQNVGYVLAYGRNHPYGEIMTEATLANIHLDQLKKHYATWFKPNISYLVIVGDVTRARAEQQARKYFGGWKRGDVPAQHYGLPRPPEATQVDFVHKPGAVQSVIRVTYPVELKPGSPDAIRVSVMNTILGGYFNSRINANLREGHGWTYGAGSSLSPDKLVADFVATASVRNAVTDSALVELLHEMERLRTEKVSQAELQVVKNVMAGEFAQNLEQPGTVANFALNTARFGLPADYYEKYLEAISAVTPEEIILMARQYLRPDRAHILVVGDRDEVAGRLRAFSKSGEIHFYDTDGYPVKEIGAVPDGITAETVVADYLSAIGGAERLEAWKDVRIRSTVKGLGPELILQTWQKGGDKFAMEMTMNSQPITRQVFDGQKGMEYGMGGASRPLEGADLSDLRERAAFAKEARYADSGYRLTLKGIAEINGAKAYEVEVLRPDGKKSTDYYDLRTSLKIREISIETGQDGQPATMTTDFADYKPVEGVLFPHTVTVAGIFPAPMKATVTLMQVNAGIDDAVFQLK